MITVKNYIKPDTLEAAYELNHKDGENTDKICLQLYDLAKLSHGSLTPERMTAFIARSNEIMLLLAGEKTEEEKNA